MSLSPRPNLGFNSDFPPLIGQDLTTRLVSIMGLVSPLPSAMKFRCQKLRGNSRIIQSTEQQDPALFGLVSQTNPIFAFRSTQTDSEDAFHRHLSFPGVSRMTQIGVQTPKEEVNSTAVKI